VNEPLPHVTMAYPNPSAGLLQVMGRPGMEDPFSVLDVAGHVVLMGALQRGMADVRVLQSGVYILRVGAGGEELRAPFVRE
jgi:hypothetical protein